MTVASWAMLVVLWVGSFIVLIYLRNAELVDAETQINNLTRVMAAESEVVLRSTEAILLYIRRTIDDGDSREREKVEDLLNSKTSRVPFLRSISVFDADGRLRYMTGISHPPSVFSVEDREWFATTRDTPTQTMIVSPPAQSRFAPNRWLVPLSLRIEGPDHSFRGAIVAALDPTYFNSLFKDLDLGPDSTVALQRADSAILARQPFAEAMLGRRFVNGPILKMLQKQRAGIVHARGAIDSDIRIMGGRMLDSFPVYVAITQSEKSILTVWRTQMVVVMSATTLISLLLFAVMRQSDTAARLEAKNEAVHALVDASPRPLATLRRMPTGAFAVEWANQHFATLLGLPLDQVLDQPLKPLLARVTTTALPHAIDDPRGSRFEISLKTSNEPNETQMLCTPVRGRIGAFDIILVTAVDMTARRMAARRDAERHLLEALGRMAGRIAHEINNVLQPILSHCSLALHANRDNDSVAQHLYEIQNGVRNGRDIVRSILNLAGGKTTVRQPHSLAEEVSAAIDLIKPSVPPRVAIETELRATDGKANLASGEMFQILSNLVGNAVDAIPEQGTIRITLDHCNVDLIESAVLDIAPGAYLQLLISDNGCGMDHDVARRALDPFYTTKPFGRGAGLGLPTVQSVVTALSGSMSLSSSPGNGTMVRILFPEVAS